jgi:hypothetical protein
MMYMIIETARSAPIAVALVCQATSGPTAAGDGTKMSSGGMAIALPGLTG